ncbi:double-strand break repair helicase AddA [Acuticoccus sp. MNP-M23]|uniref:double-strand break repair helicase AddA n=1 Tax=Acuticoccus sp. MNP-M23 TaxID=3072793 RepID=UPI00281686D5|nr:double-strand break repair helicase AddA [Acuticoccus sp. MNP-M23]WMS44214.1 double-strand break repair helicase AddA [Acuticoccus sp. MNP-M23]
MAGLNVPPEANDAQRRSSNPAASVWVSANAGAGKTYVLAQRVVRLLLSGVAPGAILCLTYTNAAAAEMAGRVYKELAALAALPDDELRENVQALAPGVDPDKAAERARTLFALSLETPGGLKVSTLHAFAAALLRRFPLEANISGAFNVLDDATAGELNDRAIAAVLAEATTRPDGPVAAAIRAAIPFVSDAGLPSMLLAFVRERTRLAAWLRDGDDTATLTASLADALGLDLDAPPPFSTSLTDADCAAIVAKVREIGTKTDNAFADALTPAIGCDDPAIRDIHWRAAFLTDKGTPRKNAVTKKVREALPDLAEKLDHELARLAALAAFEAARNVIHATVPLVQIAHRVHLVVDAEKRRRGLIDYDDQIATAMNLVRSSIAAEWVRYKLDDGIDHVMLDEAQDTAPAQWDLVDALTGEFFAGASSRQAHRTLFVVGDEKQSIYSFQGAAPHLFNEKRAHYAGLAEGASLPFAPVDLAHSFRSAPQVLAAVDRVFAAADLSTAANASAVRHVAIRDLAGGVDVWPLVGSEKGEVDPAWDAPLDTSADAAGDVRLVRAIADQIEAWATVGPDGGAPVDYGNVLILSRSRGKFAPLMNGELKARGIPAAGSDRLDVTRHIAVKDMLALARALISTDDLSLAAVLRSPLFDVVEDTLFRLCHGRDGSLWSALAEDPASAGIHATLRRWRHAARRARPFDFFAGILIGEGRRGDFAARMGSEAEDALDAFLDIALDFEGKGIPALEPFLLRLETLTEEIRRSAEGGAGKVRVMTVHGAKGLEAEVVFLADVGASIPLPKGGAVVPLAGPADTEVLALAPAKADRPRAIAAVLDAAEIAARAEHNRLLYVGMTRAERHLVVCGAYRTRKPAPGMWHEIVSAALEEGSEPRDMALGTMLAWRNPAGEAAPATTHDPKPTPAAEPAPAWLTMLAPPLPQRPPAITPSDGDHTPVTLGPDDRALPAAAYGALIHDLIERGGDLAAMTLRIATRHPALDADTAATIAGEALAALALPALAGTTHAEVDVIGDVVMPDGSVRRALGRIDRIILGDTATIVDFKTDRAVPAAATGAPRAYAQQLAIYKALVAPMLGVPVRTAIVWTATQEVMAMDAVLPPIRAASGSA